VLDYGIRAREKEAFVAVGPPHHVRRRAVSAPNFHDLPVPAPFADLLAAHFDVVTFRCLHLSASLGH